MRLYRVVGLAAALAVSGVAWAQAPESQDRSPLRPRKQPVTLTVTTDKAEYKSGDSIAVTLKVATALDTPSDFHFSSAQMYDVWVRRDTPGALGGAEVYRWSKGKIFAQSFTHLHVTHTRFAAFTVGVGGSTPRLDPGTYTIVGQLTTTDRAPRLTGQATITVR